MFKNTKSKKKQPLFPATYPPIEKFTSQINSPKDQKTKIVVIPSLHIPSFTGSSDLSFHACFTQIPLRGLKTDDKSHKKVDLYRAMCYFLEKIKGHQGLKKGVRSKHYIYHFEKL